MINTDNLDTFMELSDDLRKRLHNYTKTTIVDILTGCIDTIPLLQLSVGARERVDDNIIEIVFTNFKGTIPMSVFEQIHNSDRFHFVKYIHLKFAYPKGYSTENITSYDKIQLIVGLQLHFSDDPLSVARKVRKVAKQTTELSRSQQSNITEAVVPVAEEADIKAVRALMEVFQSRHAFSNLTFNVNDLSSAYVLEITGWSRPFTLSDMQAIEELNESDRFNQRPFYIKNSGFNIIGVQYAIVVWVQKNDSIRRLPAAVFNSMTRALKPKLVMKNTVKVDTIKEPPPTAKRPREEDLFAEATSAPKKQRIVFFDETQEPGNVDHEERLLLDNMFEYLNNHHKEMI